MKSLKLFGMFFHKNILKSLALLIISLSMCIIVSIIAANCNYYFQSVSFFSKKEILNSDFVKIYNKFNSLCEYFYLECQSDNKDYHYSINDYSNDCENFALSDVYGQIETLPAVDHVYSYTVLDKGRNIYNYADFQIICSDEPTYKLWDYSLSNGSWFWNTKESSEYPNVVLCGTIFENVDVGRNIDIIFNNSPYTVHVIGKVAAPYHTIRFTGDECSLDNFSNTIFVLRDDKTIDYFGEQILYRPASAFVAYKDSATKEEIEQCREFYESFFTNENPYFSFDLNVVLDMAGVDDIESFQGSPYDSTAELAERAKDIVMTTVTATLKQDLIIPLISTFMFVALSVLLVRKKQRDYSIYYFCGCSKRKTFLISLAGIASIAVVAGLICTGYMMWRTYIISHGMVTGGEYQYVFDTTVCLIVWGCLALCVLLSCIIPFRMIFSQKSSLLSLYRKGKE